MSNQFVFLHVTNSVKQRLFLYTTYIMPYIRDRIGSRFATTAVTSSFRGKREAVWPTQAEWVARSQSGGPGASLESRSGHLLDLFSVVAS